MSTCVDHILRHDFYDLDDKTAATAFLENAIQQVRERLRIKDDIKTEIIEYAGDEECPGYIDYSFRIPNFDADVQLGRGFWKVSQALNLSHLYHRFNGVYSLRYEIFDIARALGGDEAWHCSEYDSPYAEEDRFDEWLESVHKRLGDICEFNEEQIDRFRENNKHGIYAEIVHDSFADCRTRLEELKIRFPEYTVLNLGRIAGKYIKLHKNDGCYLADAESGSILLDYPVDDILENICGAGMIVQKDGRSAFFDVEGKRMSDFVEGIWKWKWAEGGSHDVIVYNDSENLKFVVH